MCKILSQDKEGSFIIENNCKCIHCRYVQDEHGSFRIAEEQNTSEEPTLSIHVQSAIHGKNIRCGERCGLLVFNSHTLLVSAKSYFPVYCCPQAAILFWKGCHKLSSILFQRTQSSSYAKTRRCYLSRSNTFLMLWLQVSSNLQMIHYFHVPSTEIRGQGYGHRYERSQF